MNKTRLAKEQIAEEITTGVGIGQYTDKPPRVANFLLGWDNCETYYKNIAIKFAEWVSKNGWTLRNDKETWLNSSIVIPKEKWQIKETSELLEIFLKTLENEQQCSKNGIKREGESCTLNNNCIYPKCLK